MNSLILDHARRAPVREEQPSVTVEIGDIPIELRCTDAGFCNQIKQRYAGFLSPSAPPDYRFDIRLEPLSEPSDEDASVNRNGFLWHVRRGDFRAAWDTRTRRGWIRQSANPYSLDTVLRIAHSLALANTGGLLMHSASVVRNGRVFLFAGISGAGKTTMARLAPPDVTLLTDEISYLRRVSSGYRAYGTPFAGELARAGANIAAPIAAIYFLEKGPEHRIEPVEQSMAVRTLMRHILFFAQDPGMVKRVFESALDLVSRVTVARLTFMPDQRVWELIG
jgi:hypothetical protein